MTQGNDTIVSTQFVGLKVTADTAEVEYEAEKVDDPSGPEGAMVAEVFREYATYQNSQSYACIP